jgi:chromosome segregation ATPase
MTISNNKKVLQEQVARLTNEIEELRLEREESKKNVLHFMQEADSTRQELKKAQEIIEEFTTTDHHLQGYLSPPPESIESEDDEDIKEPSKLSILLSKLSQMDQEKISNLFQLVETDNNAIQDLHNVKQSFSQLKSAHVSLKEELNQLQEEYHATRGALQIENERAEIIEKRWKESESSLEHAESTIQSLNKELSHFRQQQQECNKKVNETTDIKLIQEDLCRSKQDLAITVQNYHDCKVKLEETEQTLKHWQTKYDEIDTKNVKIYIVIKKNLYMTNSLFYNYLGLAQI